LVMPIARIVATPKMIPNRISKSRVGRVLTDLRVNKRKSIIWILVYS
jgi:hypothetical protein